MNEGKQEHHIGPSRLLSYSCEVQSSESKVPHCVLSLKLEDKTYHASSDTKTIDLLLKAPTLDTLLGSFDKIKNQLSTFDEKP